jgi:hypothetical protein
MVSCRLAIASVLVLVSSCAGQEMQVDASPGLIQDALGSAHVSGSISYWSIEPCPALSHPYAALLEVRPANHSGTPSEILQEIFAGDSKMRVTQELSGIIRMSETAVPTELLDVKIHHIEFSNYEHPKDVLPGPNLALLKILNAPEVQDFKKSHKIGEFGGGLGWLPGPVEFPYERHVFGELDDVTVSQALDYVLRVFPGFWVYGNCVGKDGDREVFVHFFQRAP